MLIPEPPTSTDLSVFICSSAHGMHGNYAQLNRKMALRLRAQNMLLVDLVPLRMRPMEKFLWRGMIVSRILGVEITYFSSDSFA